MLCFTIYILTFSCCSKRQLAMILAQNCPKTATSTWRNPLQKLQIEPKNSGYNGIWSHALCDPDANALPLERCSYNNGAYFASSVIPMKCLEICTRVDPKQFNYGSGESGVSEVHKRALLILKRRDARGAPKIRREPIFVYFAGIAQNSLVKEIINYRRKTRVKEEVFEATQKHKNAHVNWRPGAEQWRSKLLPKYQNKILLKWIKPAQLH